jgi:hypothetical protein
MITLKNTDSQKTKWYLMKKYDFDINNALASGSLGPASSTTVPSPTGTTVSVVWALADGVSAAGIVADNAASVFHNDPNGAWAQTL